MGYNGYLGPAGIFSTDDPAADQRQIEAEQYDPEEDEWWDQEDPDHDEDYEDDFVEPVEEEIVYPDLIDVYVGSEPCTWWHMDLIEEINYDAWVEQMKAKHQAECGCSAELIFTRQ